MTPRVLIFHSVQIDVEVLYKQATNELLKAQLNSLYEIIRFSNPISNNKLNDLEIKIQSKIEALKLTVSNDNIEDSLLLIKDLSMFFIERNKKCMLMI